jgi:Ca2+-binding RTX toxin-like protein
MQPRRKKAGRLLTAGVIAAGVLAGTTATANAATTSTFNTGVLSVSGDSLNNNITVSRDAAGKLLVNGGAVTVSGGTPTVANTTLIQVFGLGGNDTITLSELNGALPRANLFGGAGNDVATGGSGTDLLFGQGGNDTLLGKGGTDQLFGGSENDSLTGGDGDDQSFGESGDDRTIWNPGDDTDLNEGGAGTDTVEVNGGNGAEQFTTTANGTRVRFDRVTPAPFSLDIGTSENVVLNANGGDDTHSAAGNLAVLTKLTLDGGNGNDDIRGGNGADIILGGDGNDFADGNQGNDVAFLGAGDDSFQWDPGDGSDTVEGQAGSDTMPFNGANIAENMNVSANGGRVRFTRDVANIVMDLNDVETIAARTLGGADNLTVDDLSGTDVTEVKAELATAGDDAAADNVVANATNGDDVAVVTGSGTNLQVTGLPAKVSVSGASASTDRLSVNTLAGDDVIDASSVASDTARLILDGGAGDDVVIGGEGDDSLLGGDGDDVLIGGPGNDTANGGAGDNIIIDAVSTIATKAEVAGLDWLQDHAQVQHGKTVLKIDGEKRVLPRADL